MQGSLIKKHLRLQELQKDIPRNLIWLKYRLFLKITSRYFISYKYSVRAMLQLQCMFIYDTHIKLVNFNEEKLNKQVTQLVNRQDLVWHNIGSVSEMVFSN